MIDADGFVEVLGTERTVGHDLREDNSGTAGLEDTETDSKN